VACRPWRATLLLLLAAVEEAGDEKEQGEHEVQFRVGAGVEVELDDSVSEPYGKSDEPNPRYPGWFTHRCGLDA